MQIKNVKHVELDTKTANVVVNIKMLKCNLIVYVYVVPGITKEILMKI